MTEIPNRVCPHCGAPLAPNGVCARCLAAGLWDDDAPRTRPAGVFRQIGEYEIVEELGRGGMGIVWRARQRRLDREVALKLVREGGLADEAATKRFRREAEAAAAIRHPYVITIYEVGEVDGQLYLSMELVPGGSLADWMKRVAFSAHDAATFVAKVAEGVHHAHEQGVLHRDLKPGNILIDANEEPRVCDFGLARLIEDSMSLTMTGEVLGTPAYLSPEQASGAKLLTRATDVYSLGAILYEMLSGKPPFSATTLPALLRAVFEDDPQRPISRVSGRRVPADISTICLKCLEKDPAARYPTAKELADDLERWLNGKPILARPVARAERVIKWMRRKPLLAGLWLVITFLTILAAVGLGIMSFRLGRQKDAVAAEKVRVQQEFVRSLSDTAQRYMNAGDWLRALPPLAEAIELGTGNPRLDEVNRIRFGVLRRISPKMAGFWTREPLIRGATMSTGTRVMMAFTRHVEVWDTATGQMIGKPLTTERDISGAIFDALRGAWVAFESDGKWKIWEPETGALMENPAAPGYLYTSPESLQHRGAFFAVHRDKSVQVINRLDGRIVGGPFIHESRVLWTAYLSGSSRVISADDRGAVYLWDLETNAAAMEPFMLPKARKTPLSFEGYDYTSKVAILHSERMVWMVNCETGSARVVPSEPNEETDGFRRLSDRRWPNELPQCFGYDKEHRWFFMTRYNDGVNVRDLETGVLLWAAPHGSQGFRGDFGLESNVVATQSWNGSARVWRTMSSRPLTPFVWQAATPGSCTLDPRGQWLLTHGDEPAARLWLLPQNDGAAELPAKCEAAQNLWYAGFPERLFVAENFSNSTDGPAGGKVTVWDANPPGNMTSSVLHPEPMRWSGPAAGGSRVFTAGDTRAILWDSASGEMRGGALVLASPPVFAAADPTGERFAIVEKDGTVRLWDAARGQETRLAAGALTVEFSANGRVLLVVGRQEARAWDPSTGQPLSKPVVELDGAAQARLSADGKRVVQWTGRGSSGQHAARVWDTATGEVVCELAKHWRGIMSAAFSPDGSLVATGGHDYLLRLCDARTGKEITPPMHQPQKVSQCGFSADGLLLWAQVDEEILVWETVTGEQVTPPLRHPRHVNFATFSSDSRQIAAIGSRDLPRIWNLRPEQAPVDTLHDIAQILSAHTIVPGSSSLRPLHSEEARAAWKRNGQRVGVWKAD